MKLKNITIVCFMIILIILSCIGFYILRNITKESNKEIKDYFILYNGYEMQKQVGIQELSDMEISDENNEKYNISFHNYEKGEYLGETKGQFGEETFENMSIVANVKTIATSQKYDAIPRKFNPINKLPEKIKQMTDYSSFEIHSIDLDGDGKTENIICCIKDNKEEQEASSEINLFDDQYKKITGLVMLEDGFWGGIREESQKRFLSLEDVEYFDIDNDGIMEILINIPNYEGTKLSIIKYKSGRIEGETNIKATLLP